MLVYKRRYVLCAFFACALVSACAANYTDATGELPPKSFSFERREIAIDSTGLTTILTGFLLDGPLADVAVAYVDDHYEKRLQIYSFEQGTWIPAVEVPLGRRVSFVDVATIGGVDRLMVYEPGELKWFDLESMTTRPLVAVASNADSALAPTNEIPHVDVSRDVNGDGRDDLVVPDIDGFWVIIQVGDGSFAEPIKISRPPTIGSQYSPFGYRHEPWVRAGRIHQMDYDLDGRRDLVAWNGDHFDVYLQDRSGLFVATPVTFTTEVAFDSDDPTSLAAPLGVRHRRKDRMPVGAMSGRVLHSLTDTNADGVGDLAVLSLDVRSMWRARATYEVHFGKLTPGGGTTFARGVDASVSLDGIPFDIGQHDFDNDGRVDLLFTVIRIGILKNIRMILGALFTRSVPLSLPVYRLGRDGYPDSPSATPTTRTDSLGGSGERATLLPSVLVGDVTGDSHPDLLVGRNERELHLFPGSPGLDLLTRRPIKIRVPMPREEYCWLADVNRDGKKDVVMHHRSPREGDRVSLLIAR